MISPLKPPVPGVYVLVPLSGTNLSILVYEVDKKNCNDSVSCKDPVPPPIWRDKGIIISLLMPLY